MADSSVQQSGGDFTGIGAALADAGTGAGDTITIEGAWTVDDASPGTVADDNITIQIAGANTSYHDGIYNEANQHYRLVSSSSNQGLLVNNTGCIIDGLAIAQPGTGGSNEGIRMAADSGTVTIKNCILQADTQTSDQDGVYVGSLSVTVNIENTIAYGWGRAGFHAQASGGVRVQTWNINSCTVWDCETSADADGGGISIFLGGTRTYNINVFNSCFADAATGGSSEDFNEANSGGTKTWNIHNCIDSDGSITNRDAGAVGELENRTATDTESPGAGDFVIFEDLTTENLLLFDNDTDNDAQNAHSATSGAGMSLPTLDIALVTRDTASGKVDIGASAFAAGAPAGGRIMGAIAGEGGLAGHGGIAGKGGGIAA